MAAATQCARMAAASTRGVSSVSGREAYLAGYAEALDNVINYMRTEAMYVEGKIFQGVLTSQGRAIQNQLLEIVAELQERKDDMAANKYIQADAARFDHGDPAP